MIDVAVIGLYASIIHDGLRLHAWREPQLLALQAQLAETDLLAIVQEAFREERAGVTRTFEVSSRRDLARLFEGGADPRGLREKLERSGFLLALTCAPRGWFYQNMRFGAELQQEWLPCLDVSNRVVLAQKASNIMDSNSAKFEHPFPYAMLVKRALPNFLKAIQTTARNQVLVDQARVACGIERYRLAKGQVPESLAALSPEFMEKAPHDVIGGGPLKYRRADGKGYLCYSIGWNERDDGGVIGQSREEGDWVWEMN
jgi:hypothetical protein